MIGDGWDGEPSTRPGPPEPIDLPRKRVAVITGSRSEFGLLVPVMRAIAAHPRLELLVVAAGEHLIPPALTFRDVRAAFPVADSVPMQRVGRTSRPDAAEATGWGIARFTRSFASLSPDWVVVLGDRIEAFAAASAASIAGIAVAHIHGGDRAEGIADEALRRAISALAHLHLPATATSADRLRRSGERTAHVHVVGSPAIDGLDRIAPLSDDALGSLTGTPSAPCAVLLLHPAGRHAEHEESVAGAALGALAQVFADGPVFALHPNHDPGREGIVRALPPPDSAGPVRTRAHLPRPAFVGLLKRLAEAGGVLVGNSSAALIEAAALRLPAVDIGPRQSGRERAGNVVHADAETIEAIARAVRAACALDRASLSHPYGDGRAGERIAEHLASLDPRDPALLRKRCAF